MVLARVISLPLLLVCTLTGCTLFNREQDVVQVAPLPVVEQQFTPIKVWQYALGSGVGQFYSRLQPAYQDGKVYVANRRGMIVALDNKSGKLLWKNDLPKQKRRVNQHGRSAFSTQRSAMLAGGITVVGEHLLLGSEKAEVIALSASTGQLLWRTTAAGEIISSPVSSKDQVVVHTNNGVLQAFNLADGTLRWQLNLDLPILSLRGGSRPALSPTEVALVGGKNGRMNAVLMAQGSLIWQQQISQPTGTTDIDRLNDIAATPVVVDNRLFTLSYNGHLTALDLYSGQIIWQRAAPSATDFVVNGHQIYLVDQSDNVVAFDARSGTELWRQGELSYRQLTAPSIYSGYLVVGDAQGYLHWLNLDNGRFAAQQKIDASGLYTAPIVAEDKLLLQARSGKIYALKY